MTDLHDEVLDAARALIRLDTTNRGYEGTETLAAEWLGGYLSDAGVEVELVAREPSRANVVARIPGSDPAAPSLAFVGHTDVVPVDGQTWTHPPFEAVVDDGWLYGRGAIDMKNEVAVRAVAMARLAREGFRPRGDLWFVAVADEEDGRADVGMRWLLEQRPDIRPDLAINEGGGERLPLADGRTVLSLSVGEKGTCPVRLVAVGEAGHASMPEVGDNAVPHLAALLGRIGTGMPVPVHSPEVVSTLEVLLGRPVGDLGADLAEAASLHPALGHLLPSLPGTTMAPTVLAASTARNVMPARASVELDCRTLPGTTVEEVLAAVRQRLGDATGYELELCEDAVPGSASPATGLLPDAVAACLAEEGDEAMVMPMLCTGFTDSVHLRAAAGTAAYGFSPFRATPAEVLAAGYHNADERVHVDDLHFSARFHLALAKRLLG
ncbi:M20/M25/M40 family metallo-hydrolase [Nocardioides euryhalodurans]|uniref:M20/M25/M40 family metallo-hydrolase n=1 Tax=Nocardioides euryhalodurans TaxID=2518370 RepID=A0A4P7GGV8_9ACTN|nr:M20/M25/M40 family metallo-hydrolase [Nocardioides euryhalodurans]QBR90983.1 M20/M25/M40 family metallo-hydrolase [Nocardioides euryhalodurans]